MSEFSRPLSLQELRYFEKLKKYKHHARHAIKDLQRMMNLWKEIALKHMADADRWRAEYQLRSKEYWEKDKEVKELLGQKYFADQIKVGKRTE